MPLPTTGQITLQDIKNEFGPNFPNIPVNLSDYYRGGQYVRNVQTNINVPTQGQISLNNFRGAAKYEGSATIIISPEVPGISDRGWVEVTVRGTSPTYVVTWSSVRLGVQQPTLGLTRTMTANQTYRHGGARLFQPNGPYFFDYRSEVTVTITDVAGTRSTGPHLIGYTQYGAFQRTIELTF